MRWEPLQIRIEPKPTAAAVGVFLPAAACSKTRYREALSRAPGEDALKAANKKPPPANAGRGEGRRSLDKIPGRHTEKCGNALRARYPLAGTAHAWHQSKQTGSHGQAAFREIQCSPLPHQAAPLYSVQWEMSQFQPGSIVTTGSIRSKSSVGSKADTGLPSSV